MATKLVSRGNVLTNQEVYVFQGYVTVSNRCENAIGTCEPNAISIGVGQQVNAATINMAGKILGVKSSGLLEGCGGDMSKTIVKQGVGASKGKSVVVKCR